ncbi:conjugal transfer protein TraB [Streptomyces sp. NPDC021562]|uniref:conjugal transfer protein TraB n=1 Tax=Streptomyces sp. NPDC021562 TaxID=3155121 RepID=UPI0033FCFEDE
MGTPAPYSAQVPPPQDGDNSYKAVQAKLFALGQALDSADSELEQLQLRMKLNARESEVLAGHIAHAELDPVFVEMQNAVSVALGGAEIAVRNLVARARDAAAKAHETRTTHARLYEGLDRVRSGRRYRTPKPAFFDD